MSPLKKIKLALLYFSLLLCIIFIFVNKKPQLTRLDKTYIDSFLSEWKIKETPQQVHVSFDSEASFIQKLVTSVVSTIQHNEISFKEFGNIKYYYKNRKGQCFDRSILLEKIFKYYDFNFRHVFIYFLKKSTQEPHVIDFFRKSTLSHAVTEVETKAGWVVIDSNTDCIGIDKNGKTINIGDLKKQVRQKGSLDLKQNCTSGEPPFWMIYPNFKFIYGVYSRSGSFLSNYKGIPGVNIKMCFYNL